MPVATWVREHPAGPYTQAVSTPGLRLEGRSVLVTGCETRPECREGTMAFLSQHPAGPWGPVPIRTPGAAGRAASSEGRRGQEDTGQEPSLHGLGCWTPGPTCQTAASGQHRNVSGIRLMSEGVRREAGTGRPEAGAAAMPCRSGTRGDAYAAGSVPLALQGEAGAPLGAPKRAWLRGL